MSPAAAWPRHGGGGGLRNPGLIKGGFFFSSAFEDAIARLRHVEKLSVFIMVADVATRWRLFSANNSVSLYPLKILRPLSAPAHSHSLHIHMYKHTHSHRGKPVAIQPHTHTHTIFPPTFQAPKAPFPLKKKNAPSFFSVFFLYSENFLRRCLSDPFTRSQLPRLYSGKCVSPIEK